MSNARTVSRGATGTSTIDTVDQWKHGGAEVSCKKVTGNIEAQRIDRIIVRLDLNVPGVERVNIGHLHVECDGGSWRLIIDKWLGTDI